MLREAALSSWGCSCKFKLNSWNCHLHHQLINVKWHIYGLTHWALLNPMFGEKWNKFWTSEFLKKRIFKIQFHIQSESHTRCRQCFEKSLTVYQFIFYRISKSKFDWMLHMLLTLSCGSRSLWWNVYFSATWINTVDVRLTETTGVIHNQRDIFASSFIGISGPWSSLHSWNFVLFIAEESWKACGIHRLGKTNNLHLEWNCIQAVVDKGCLKLTSDKFVNFFFTVNYLDLVMYSCQCILILSQ